MFGSSVYRLIPNNKYRKTAALARGEHFLFVGFHPERDGYYLFDPSQRRFVTGGENCHFLEDFDARKDHLRAFDRRRLIERQHGEQPLLVNDNEWSSYDKLNSESVRNLYDLYESEPETIDTEPTTTSREEAAITPDERVRHILERLNFSDDGNTEDEDPAEDDHRAATAAPAAPQKESTETLRKAAQKAVDIIKQVTPLRPVRHAPIGKPVALTNEDKRFIKYAIEFNIPVKSLSPNPKRGGSSSRTNYFKYMKAGSAKEALELGAKVQDLKWDHERGFIYYPKHESVEPGHIVHHARFAEATGQTHVLQDLGLGNDEEQLLQTAFRVMNDLNRHATVVSASEGDDEQPADGASGGLKRCCDDCSPTTERTSPPISGVPVFRNLAALKIKEGLFFGSSSPDNQIFW